MKIAKAMAYSSVLVLAIGFFWLANRGEAQPPADKLLFIRGTVAVRLVGPGQKPKDIALPRAQVFLLRRTDLNKPIASALSDLSGRFSIKTAARGGYVLCVAAEGYARTCETKGLELGSNSVRYGVLAIPAPRIDGAATIYGSVTLADGSTPRGFEPLMGVNEYAQVEMAPSSGAARKTHVNNFGEYVIPGAPVRSAFTLTARMDSITETRTILPQTNMAAGVAHRIDLQFANTPPEIRTVSAMASGKPVQLAAPGSKVILNAVSKDIDGNAVRYRWRLPDGTVVGPSPDSKLEFTVPMRDGYHSVSVLVSDDKSGYTSSSVTIRAGSGNMQFSGTVNTATGAPATSVQVLVNGRVTTTNSRGGFNLQIPPTDRYVMTMRSIDGSLGLTSYVYKAPIMGGRWTMRLAQTTSFDPTKAISMQHKRGERDCTGPRSSRVDWQNYAGRPGLIEFQDGKGNRIAPPDRENKRLQQASNVSRLLGRISPVLGEHFSRTNFGQVLKTEPLPCQAGIQVDIPPNSLEDPSNHTAPAGNVKVSVSAIDLNAPSHMPGDYTAFDAANKPVSMESIGAGSIEILSATGRRLNLKPGSMATVTIPVDATQRIGGANLSPTIPFLYYDETRGTWTQDGVAKLNPAKTAYVKTDVKHFSTMNADILKTGQSCVAVELDAASGLSVPLTIEAAMPPSQVNPGVLQVRNYTMDHPTQNVLYNLPNNADIVITPIIAGVRPDGSAGDVAAGVFVVNTGGPMSSATNPPAPNPDGTYYSESGAGVATGPCGSRVRLKKLTVPPLSSPNEFLQGLSMQSSNINEFSSTIQDLIRKGAEDYYGQADPRGFRASFNLFKTKNRFGQPQAGGEVEFDAQYSNSGDLGFGREMHCRVNNASDGGKDYACYVTNYGQPPKNNPDQQDADDALGGPGHNFPDATVCMEYSRVENPNGAAQDFPNNDRTVKFYAYNTNAPDALPVTDADLDGFGPRPIPQLCVICHGGDTALTLVDPVDPLSPTVGAFTSRADVMSMSSNFLPFDLHYFNFPAGKVKAVQQPAFKNLNQQVVRPVAVGNGARGVAIKDIVDAWYATTTDQKGDALVAGWDVADPNSKKLYRDVFARACRTCHTALPYNAPAYTTKAEFDSDIARIQSKVCNDKIMPHAKRTNDIFWTSIAPNMPGFLQQYGQTLPGWDPVSVNAQCGLFVQPGSNVTSVFQTQIYPILTSKCSGCHSATGNANFAVAGAATTYTQLLNAPARDGVSRYIVANNTGASLLFQLVTTTDTSKRMPLGGAPLSAAQITAIQDWINGGATN